MSSFFVIPRTFLSEQLLCLCEQLIQIIFDYSHTIFFVVDDRFITIFDCLYQIKKTVHHSTMMLHCQCAFEHQNSMFLYFNDVMHGPTIGKLSVITDDSVESQFREFICALPTSAVFSSKIISYDKRLYFISISNDIDETLYINEIEFDNTTMTFGLHNKYKLEENSQWNHRLTNVLNIHAINKKIYFISSVRFLEQDCFTVFSFDIVYKNITKRETIPVNFSCLYSACGVEYAYVFTFEAVHVFCFSTKTWITKKWTCNSMPLFGRQDACVATYNQNIVYFPYLLSGQHEMLLPNKCKTCGLFEDYYDFFNHSWHVCYHRGSDTRLNLRCTALT